MMSRGSRISEIRVSWRGTAGVVMSLSGVSGLIGLMGLVGLDGELMPEGELT